MEQDFFPVWRRYTRALKQRNALLKAGGSDAQLDSWDRELVDAGEPLTRYRRAYLERLQEEMPALCEDLAPTLGRPELRYSPGWKRGSCRWRMPCCWRGREIVFWDIPPPGRIGRIGGRVVQ